MNLELLRCPSARPAAEHHPTILFVHGSYCGAWVWAEHFMPHFAEAGYASLAVSLRGHGDSEGRFSTATLDDYIADVHSAMDHLDGDCILIGHSLGGLVVQHCLAGDERVRAAVLLSSVPPSGLASSALHLSLFSPDVCLQLGILQSIGPWAVKGEVIRKALFDPATPAATVNRLLPRFQQESHRICVELLNPVRPRLPRRPGQPPVLVLGGDSDALVPGFALFETAAYFGADLDILAGAPHGVMLDATWWRPVAERTLSWLAGKHI